MEIEIIDDKENALLKRRELKLRIKHPQSPTPKKQDLVKEMAAKYSVSEDHVIVDYIFTKKGVNESDAKVKIYQEPPKIRIKKKKAEEKKPQEKPAEEKPKEIKSEAQAGEAK